MPRIAPSARTLITLVLLALLLSGSAAGTDNYASEQAGIFSGIWHGWIAPFAIIGHVLFNDEIRIYEPNNTGIFYDIGFYVAVISGFGTLSLRRGKSTRDKREASAQKS